MSSRPIKAQWFIKYLPNSNGEAPGLRLMVTVFLVFLEQALSSTLMCSMVLDHPVVVRETLTSTGAPFVAISGHALGVGAEQGVEQVIRIARK